MQVDPRLAAKLALWREHPVEGIRELFGVEPDPWQLEVIEAFGQPEKADTQNPRIMLKACKNPGKTAVLAWLIWLFELTRPHSRTFATSINGPNLADGLWTELAKWQHKSPLLSQMFEWSATMIRHRGFPSTWYMAARHWRQSANSEQQADTLAGKHSDYQLFVLDEVGGIPNSVMAAAEASLGSGKETRILAAGNPTHRSGPLYDACGRNRTAWKLFQITGDPDSPNRAPRVKLEWAMQQRKMLGENSPWYRVNVLGEFPEADINALLSPEDVDEAMRRNPRPEEYDWAQKRLGVDCARFGDDRSVIFPRQGLAAFDPVILRQVRGTEIAARIMLAKKNWDHEIELIDDTGGWGHSTIDTLISGGHSPISVQFHAPAIDPAYKNRRAEMWMEMAKWIKRGGCLPNIPELVEELVTPTYTYQNGKFLIEDKDSIKERLTRSPDLADALALTFAIPDQPARHVLDPEGYILSLAGAFKASNRQRVEDDDPFSEERLKKMRGRDS